MVACGQMLSHFKDDAAGNGSAGECAEAILVEKQVERHVAEMQKKGAIPAKKEQTCGSSGYIRPGGVVADAAPLGHLYQKISKRYPKV